jgi:plasmid stabilization system protein ParE
LSVSRQVVFRPEAEDEVLEVREWYEARRPGLGSEFAQAVDAIVASIVENPFLYQRAHQETRRAVLSRFPYAVYYRVSGDDIVVQAVHGRQHPAHWQRRS